MRTAFAEELLDLARLDERIWLVTGDLGYSVLEPFADAFPARFLNAGVAEQSMLGLAAGLAHEGATVIVYSIANFPTFRALEQIRNDIAYAGAAVLVVAVGSGFSYGGHGSTHHAIEDLAAMSSLPNMMVVSPGDPVEARHALRHLVAGRRPAYLRLGKAGETVIPSQTGDPFVIGRHRRLRVGSDVAIMATGSILGSAWEATIALERQGIDAALFSAHTLRPFDVDSVLEAIATTGGIVTVEEHRAFGGLRTAVAETLMDARPEKGRVVSLAVPQDQILGTGSQTRLRNQTGLTSDAIVAAALRVVAP